MRITLKILTVAWLAVALAACGTAAEQVTVTLPAATSATGTQHASPATPKASTCDAVREALLTGTPAEVTVAMQALVKDKSATQKARENAQAWLDTSDRELKKLNAMVIQMGCENAEA